MLWSSSNKLTGMSYMSSSRFSLKFRANRICCWQIRLRVKIEFCFEIWVLINSQFKWKSKYFLRFSFKTRVKIQLFLEKFNLKLIWNSLKVWVKNLPKIFKATFFFAISKSKFYQICWAKSKKMSKSHLKYFLVIDLSKFS